jgi:methionyl-tRNA formyltransferase
MLKIVFFGTGSFGLEALKFLSCNYNVVSVVTGLPKEAGRGHKLTINPIHKEAEALGLEVINSGKPTTEDLKKDFDIGIVVSYGAIISKAVLEKAKFGFLNIHPSDLPKFRGASPIERTIELGETNTRICIIKMTPKLDDGNIMASSYYTIQEDETSLDLHLKFAKIGAHLLNEAISNLINGTKGEEQNHEIATYAKKISKEELFLQGDGLTMVQVNNKVRAFASYGFPFIMHEGKRIKILKAESTSFQKSKIDVKCIDGFLTPTLIKVEGKNTTQNYFTI